VGNANGEKKRISMIAAVIITVGLGVVMLYFGISLAAFGFYAFTEDEVLIGALALLLGGVLVSIPGAVVVSQVRAYLRRRG
jgi:biotin transporter BioY